MPLPSKQKNSVKKLIKSSKSSGDIMSRSTPLEFGSDDVRMLIYGQSGTGKTTLWSSFPGPIISLMYSGIKKTGELKSLNTKANRDKIKAFQLDEVDQFREWIDYLKEHDEIKTKVLDHVSGLQDFVLKEILNLDEIPEQKSWGLASQQDWGQCTMQCKELLRAFLDLPGNVVIIGQQRENDPVEDDEIVVPHIGVATTPGLAGWLNPTCDYVVQTFKRNRTVESSIKTKINGKTVETKTKKRTGDIEYCLRTGPHESITTKFRIPKGQPLPKVIVDPTYAKIVKVIRGE